MITNVRHRHGRGALFDEAGRVDLLARDLDLPVTARRTWLQAWADTTPRWEPWLVLVEDEAGALLAVAPLARRRTRALLDVVLLGHGPTDDARLPARSAKAAQALADAVAAALAEAGRWRLRLQQVPDPDPVVAALVAALPVTRLVPGQGMPLVEVTGSDPDAYASRNTKKALAKIRNRLAARGLEPALAWTSDPQRVRDLLPELERVHRERDLALGRRPDHDDPAAAAFYREVIVRHADAGEVDLLTLHLDGDLAAYVCGFRDGRTLRSWDNRLAPRWAELSAGRIANTEAVRRVVTDPGYDALDWMRGEEPYKLQYATRVVPTADLTAWSSPRLRAAEDLAGRAETQVRGLVSRSPRAERLARRLRGQP